MASTGRKRRPEVESLYRRLRTSRYVRLVHLPADHGADAVCQALFAVLGELRSVRVTIRWAD